MKSSVDTLVLKTIDELKQWRHSRTNSANGKASSLTGFVPTMGALHEGHASLIKASVCECERTLVSIFVNPTQFGPNEDFQKYPRMFERDLDLCRREGVTAVFHPDVNEFYPEGTEQLTRVSPPEQLINRLCGLFRPGHFEGVATVVAKLFGVAEPDRAYFGEKDYQQLAVIKKMTQDLNLPLTVVPVPTARENDGLAMSSRNAYLTPEQRAIAPAIYRTLCLVRDRIQQGSSIDRAIDEAKQHLLQSGPFELQYLEVCHPQTLIDLSKPQPHMVILVAAKLGGVRLIDNLITR